MQEPTKQSSRKKFLLWGAAVFTSITAFKLFSNKNNSRSQRGKTREAIKMLSQDGTLVEVDIEKLFCGKRKKITDEQLKNWINKK